MGFYKLYYSWIYIGRKKRTIIIVCFALIATFILLNILQINFNILPNKQSVKKSAKSQLERFISNDEVTLNEICFDQVEAKMFRTRQNDPVGYFEYIDRRIPSHNRCKRNQT